MLGVRPALETLAQTRWDLDRHRRRRHRRRRRARSGAAREKHSLAGAEGFRLGRVEPFVENGARRPALSRRGAFPADPRRPARARAHGARIAGSGDPPALRLRGAQGRIPWTLADEGGAVALRFSRRHPRSSLARSRQAARTHSRPFAARPASGRWSTPTPSPTTRGWCCASCTKQPPKALVSRIICAWRRSSAKATRSRYSRATKSAASKRR